jgi:uncharacterized protein
MELKRWNDILALKTVSGEIIGHHAKNLDVAELSEELWDSMTSQSDAEAVEQLNSWDQEISDEVQAEKAKHKIQSISINVTQICNLACVYCAAGKDGTYGSPTKRISVEKTIPQLKILMERLEDGDKFNITFLGGEPLLYPEGMELIADYAMAMGKEKNLTLAFNTITNGTLLTDKNIEVLKSFNSNVTISLDGAPEVNDVVRPTKTGASSTAQVQEGILRLNKNRAGLKSVGVQGVFGPYNSKPLDAYKFYKSLGVDWFDFHFDQESSDRAASEQFTADLQAIAEIAMKEGGETALRQIKFFNSLFNQLDQKTRVENFCGSGKSYIVLDAQNRAFTCPWAVNDVNLAVGSGTELLQENLQPIKKSLISTNNCGDCWARHLCGGGCMWAHKKATGDKHQVDTVYCDRTRSLISSAISYYYSLRKAH